MLSKSDKELMKQYLDVLRKSGLDVDAEEQILVWMLMVIIVI